MDPDVAWAMMLENFADENWHEAAEHAEAILSWLRIGGFPPLTTIVSDNGMATIKLDDVQANRAVADSVARAVCLASQAKINGS